MRGLVVALTFAAGFTCCVTGHASASEIILGGDIGDRGKVQIIKSSSNPGSHRIQYSVKDTEIVFTPGGGAIDSPPTNGAAVVLFSDADCQCLNLAPAPAVSPGWVQAPSSGTPMRYKWKDDATKSSAQVSGGKVKFTKRGDITYGLDASPQGEVEVQITFGDSADRFCSRFSAPSSSNDTATKYKSSVEVAGFAACSPVPAHCSCALTSTTTTTTVTTTTATTTTTLSGCFTDLGDGTISDSCTGLQWEKKTNVAGLHNVNTEYSWAGCCNGVCGTTNYCQPNAAAAALCMAQAEGGTQGCNVCVIGTCDVDPGSVGVATTVWDWLRQVNAATFAGHNDWRLPRQGGCNSCWSGSPTFTCSSCNPHELERILLAPYPCQSSPASSPCINPIFGPTGGAYYWSASTAPSNVDPRFAWEVEFAFGRVAAGGKTSNHYVRAVR